MTVADTMADVVVIGAGITGLVTAYQAIRWGYRVTVVDADHEGRASDAGAGIINPLDLSEAASPAERQRVALFGVRSYDSLLEELISDGESDHGYVRVGQIVVAGDDEQDLILDRLSDRIANVEAGQLLAYTGQPQRIAGVQAARMVPYGAPNMHRLLLPGIAEVDGRRLRACLVRALRKRGVVWREGVGRIVTAHGSVVGVEVGTERIATGRVVAATGAWPVAAGDFEVAPLVVPIRGQIIHLSHAGKLSDPTPVMSSIGGPYILAFGCRVVAGATHEHVGFDYRVTAGGLAGLLTQALRIAPGLADASWIETRIGFRPMSPDGLPVIGPVPGIDGAIVATGLGAHGLTLGPAVGTIAARLAFEQDPGLDVGPLSLERFESSPEVPAESKNF